MARSRLIEMLSKKEHMERIESKLEKNEKLKIIRLKTKLHPRIKINLMKYYGFKPIFNVNEIKKKKYIKAS